MSTVMAADYAGLIEPLARHFWNEPNEQLSKPGKLFFGTNGSKSVDVEKNVFYDHESKDGGGVIKLVQCCTGIKTRGEAHQWLVQNGIVGEDKNKTSIGRQVMQVMKSSSALEGRRVRLAGHRGLWGGGILERQDDEIEAQFLTRVRYMEATHDQT